MAPPVARVIRRHVWSMAGPVLNRQLLLRARPTPAVTQRLFEAVDSPMPTMRDDHALVRVEVLSIDPGQASHIATEPGHMPAVPLGGVMRAIGVGTVVASRLPGIEAGERVVGWLGWQEYALVGRAAVWRKLDPRLPEPSSTALGVLGHSGLAAYVGVKRVCAPRPGETMLVTSAAGAVGSAAGQIAKLAGCARTVGVCGSDEKAALCTGAYGYDAAINYRTSPDLAAAIAEAAPDGVDCVLDNVGGEQFDAALAALNIGGRVALCGAVAEIGRPMALSPPGGPRPNRQLLLKRARVEGFLVLDHADTFDQMLDDLRGWFRDGRLAHREQTAIGLDSAPRALERVLRGDNVGKQLVQVERPDDEEE